MPGLKKPELLAPVGSWEAFLAAVENGADAVYLGGKQFSARQYANNFDEEQLKEAFDYAHIRGVKVFVTVNTLLKNTELEPVLDYLRFLYEAGVDAVIVQDLGLVKLCRELLPELELHASTQMTVHNLAGVKAMQELGFSRIVLAREVGLANIRHIKEQSGAELEVFVHGALCISYSGQCLMSSLIGGRSGNRGRCAQPCRLKYQLIDSKGKAVSGADEGLHLLSPKDLKTADFIPDLVQAGVDSFKIEGRMKRAEYVATVVKVYREAIDDYYANYTECATDFRLKAEAERDLKQIFNRDFTTGYFYGNPGKDLMSYNRPNNRGLRLGRIVGFDKQTRRITIELEQELNLGDGIEVWVTKGGRKGTTLTEMWINHKPVETAPAGSKVELDFPAKTSIGDRVFKTLDARLMEQAQESFMTPHKNKKLPLTMRVTGRLGEALALTVSDARGFQTTAYTNFKAEQAQKRPLTREVLDNQFSRLGNTPFSLQNLELDIEGELMVPMSELNEVRRRAVESLEETILAGYLRPRVTKGELKQGLGRLLAVTGQGTKTSKLPQLAVQTGSLEVVRHCNNRDIADVYFEDLWARADYREVVSNASNTRLLLVTPRITQDDELEQYTRVLERMVDAQPAGFLVSNYGMLEMLQTKGFEGLLYGDFGLNILNSLTLLQLRELGFGRLTISPELTFDELEYTLRDVTLPVEALVHGFLPMMISDYCAVGSVLGGKDKAGKCTGPCHKERFYLRDRMNFDFPVLTDQFCHMHIFNPKELAMIEDLPRLASLGLTSIRLDLRLHDDRTAKRIIDLYAKELTSYQASGRNFDAADSKMQLEELSPSGLTKGHYYRGVE